MIVDIATIHALTHAASEARAGNVTGAIVIRFAGESYEITVSGSACDDLNASHAALTTARACLMAQEAKISAERPCAPVLPMPSLLASCSEA
jgi:hypothetical protein